MKNKSYFKSGLIASLLTILVCVGIIRLYFFLTDDFRLANITYDIPFHAEWEIPQISPEDEQQLDTILNQKFYYIGKGAQSYAFGSADQKYVLKFFKFKHLKPSLFLQILPAFPPFNHYSSKQIKRKEKKLAAVFNGYRLAYGKDKEESGLIYIHLNPSTTLHKKAVVVDKIGIERTIDLDPIVFIIQRKGVTTRAVLTEALNKGDLALAQKRIRQIFDLYLSEYQKGLYDHDHGVTHNTGFIGDKPIHLDVGKLNYDERIKQLEYYKEDLLLVTERLKHWLKSNYPKEYPSLAQNIEEKLSEIFQPPKN